MKVLTKDIQGWELLEPFDPMVKKFTLRMFERAQAELPKVLKNSGKLGMARYITLKVEIDAENKVTTYQTAYAVALRDGNTFMGVAPSENSAKYRIRRLIKTGRLDCNSGSSKLRLAKY